MWISIHRIVFLDTNKNVSIELKSDSRVSENNTANHITFTNNNNAV